MRDQYVITSATDGNITAWFEPEVGPERARQLIESYEVDYRKYRPTYGAGLTRDMENNNWVFDGSPIRINVLGQLFDGQHRLRAVMQSGTTQEFLFVRGLPLTAYDTTDTGLPRNYGDSLRRRSYQNVATRTALIKLIGRWQSEYSMEHTRRLTTSELDRIHDMYVDSINRAVQQGVGTNQKMGLPLALTCFIWWVLREIDVNKATEFMAGLAEGENLRRGQPVYYLRERLRRERGDINYTNTEYLYLVFKAWNLFLYGNTSTERIVVPSNISREALRVLLNLDPKEAELIGAVKTGDSA